MDALTIDGSADSPALVRLGSTLGLFYRKTVSGVKQGMLKTSTDDGITWSGATQLSSETANVYQIQATNVAGTVYVFWSLSNTSGTVRSLTSTDLGSWSSQSTLGRTIGPLQSNTYPIFDVRNFASGTWGLAWINGSTTGDYPVGAGDLAYPVVWFATSTDLASWSTAQELSVAYNTKQRWPGGISLGQDGSGTVYLSWTHNL